MTCSFFFFFLWLNTWSVLLVGIKWSICMSKSLRIFCVLFSRVDYCLCIYHLVVSSNPYYYHCFLDLLFDAIIHEVFYMKFKVNKGFSLIFIEKIRLKSFFYVCVHFNNGILVIFILIVLIGPRPISVFKNFSISISISKYLYFDSYLRCFFLIGWYFYQIVLWLNHLLMDSTTLHNTGRRSNTKSV